MERPPKNISHNRCFLREEYTVKVFFQGISWNTVSRSFHETWNTFMKYFYLSIQHSETVVQVCSVNKVFLENSQNSQENASTRVSFLIKLQTWGQSPATLFKKVSGTGVFLLILWDFQEHIYLQNAPGGCFW